MRISDWSSDVCSSDLFGDGELMVNPMSNKGPVQQEMESLLAAAFPDANFTLSNDSASHHGHMGDDGSGESHFSLTIEWAGFAGMNRVARPRDRKSGVKGKRGLVRVDLGGGRCIKKKNI